jgi:hypothetical protein
MIRGLTIVPAVCVFLAAPACTTYVGDLEFVSLEPATPAMMKTGRYSAMGPDGKDKNSFEGERWRFRSDARFRVRFRSRTNFADFSGSQGVNVSTCPFDDNRSIGSSYVFMGGYAIDELEREQGTVVSKTWIQGVYQGSTRYEGPSGIEPVDGYYVYEGFIPYQTLTVYSDETKAFLNLSIIDTVQDLCFKVAGTSMPWPTNDSNIAFVPADALRAAMKAEESSRSQKAK